MMVRAGGRSSSCSGQAASASVSQPAPTRGQSQGNRTSAPALGRQGAGRLSFKASCGLRLFFFSGPGRGTTAAAPAGPEFAVSVVEAWQAAQAFQTASR